MSVERDERGWAVEASEFLNSASRERRGQSVDLEMDALGLDIKVEEGSGYMA